MAARRRRRTRRRRAARRPGLRVVLVVGLLAAAVVAAAWLVPAPRIRPHAAPPSVAPVLAGADVSWPTCRHPAANPMPGPVAFGIVGVNDGVPGTRNPCLAQQVAWAAAATGGSTQPRIGYYAMAADPFSPWESRWVKPQWPVSARWRSAEIPVPTAWGGCTGAHRQRGCAYVFGFETAWRDAHLDGVESAADATWWLDVEAVRDWSDDPGWNQAIVEGMAAYLGGAPRAGGLGARVGVYSNEYFWSAIVGDLRAGSPLAALPNWYPIGPASRADAATALRELVPVTPEGRVEIVQHVEGGVDLNVAAAHG